MLKIISGGQTGVDRAALDVAMALKIPCGGWCPKGRKAEDGMLAAMYPLTETPRWDYSQRTEWNVRDADGTLVLYFGEMTSGTSLTVSIARSLKKPLFLVNLDESVPTKAVRAWMCANGISTLNIAGPRESHDPGVIYSSARAYIQSLLDVGAKEARPHHVYMLEMGNGRIYTGITVDLERRFRQHAEGKGAKTTRAFGAARLVYTEKYPSLSAALKREAQLKRWTRKQKMELISTSG